MTKGHVGVTELLCGKILLKLGVISNVRGSRDGKYESILLKWLATELEKDYVGVHFRNIMTKVQTLLGERARCREAKAHKPHARDDEKKVTQNGHTQGPLASLLQPCSAAVKVGGLSWCVDGQILEEMLDCVPEIMSNQGTNQEAQDLHMQLERIAAFLNVPLPEAKRNALAEAVSFKAMAGSITQRKGEIGDWKNHMGDEEWSLLDQSIAELAIRQNAQPASAKACTDMGTTAL